MSKAASRKRSEERPFEREERVIPVVVMGLGYIGRAIAHAALLHPGLELVGAVDSDPSLAGRLLGEVLGTHAAGRVTADLKALRRPDGAVLLHATGSRVDTVAPQILAALQAGFSVVSTCEELAFPWLYHPEVAEGLERVAQEARVAVLGTGVNPGFVLDRLVATAGALTGRVEHVLGVRVVDARTRREALQRKVGAGLTEEEFERELGAERVGHVGLPESCALAALGLGLDCDEVEEEIEPVIADEDAAGTVPVQRGQVAGIHQVARGFSEGREVVRLELTIAMGAEHPGDRICIQGEPPIEIEVRGGVAGDAATAWAVVNAVPSVAQAEPGLLTVLDLPAGR